LPPSTHSFEGRPGVEEGAKGGGGGILRGPLHMSSDMGIISLVGALCQSPVSATNQINSGAKTLRQ